MGQMNEWKKYVKMSAEPQTLAFSEPEPLGHASQTFGKYAMVYDDDRRPLIPGYDAFYGAGLRLIADEMADVMQERPLRVLDLGAGTGLFGAMALESLNIGALTLVDASPEMLAEAEKRFAGDPRVRTIAGDLTEVDLGSDWDVILSALAIHHLSHDAKRGLYARIHRALRPAGRFVNAEQVLAPSPEQELRYRKFWQEDVRRNGVDDAGVAASLDRQRHDIAAPTSEQLQWLREAGFGEVDCLYKNW